MQFDNTYEFFLDSNGFVRAFRPTDESAPNYALVLNSGYNPGVYSTDASGKMTLLMADGTEGTYEINFKDSASNLGKQLHGSTATTAQGVVELKGFMGTDYTDNSTTRPWHTDYATGYTFADGDGVATDDRAGQALGYVIKYTINDNNVVTVQNVIGAVGAGKYAVNPGLTTDTQLSAANVHTLSTLSDALYSTYSTGNARVYYTANEAVAIDRNTVAFYFEDKDNDRVADDGEYGVAIGYDNMADVDAGQHFMASTVVNTSYNTATQKYVYRSTNLADVILFDQANIITARDYAFVLSANRTASNDQVTLQVLFENGEAGTLVVEKSHYDNIFTGNEKFNRAYAYTTNGDGISTLTATTTSMKTGVGYRLEVGTVALNEGLGIRDNYYPYDVDSINIWDVTNASAGEDGVKMSDFSTNDWNAILILDTNGKVRTAFVWEYDGTGPSLGDGFDFDWNLGTYGEYVTLYDYHNAREIYAAFDEGKNVLIRADYNLGLDLGSNRLTIPEGRILYVDGDLNANLPVVGGGTLWVSGDYDNNNAEIRVNTQIGTDLNLYVNTEISSTVAVVGNILEQPSVNLELTTDGWVYSGKTVDVTNLTVYGHIEAEDYSCTNVYVYSNKTLIARNDLSVSGNLVIGGTVNSVTYTGAVNIGGDLNTTAANVDVNNGTLTMVGNGTVNVATVDVLADGEMDANSVTASGAVTVAGTLTGSSLTGDGVTISGTVTLSGVVNGGATGTTVSSTGELTAASVDGLGGFKPAPGADITLTDSTADVTVGNNIASGEYAGSVSLSGNTAIAADDEATVDGDLALDTHTLTVNGDLTVGGDVTGTGTISVAGTGTVTLNGAVDATKVTATADGAKVVFGRTAQPAINASLTGYYWAPTSTSATEGAAITNSADLVGVTFVYDEDANTTGAWVATVTKAEKPDATLTITSGTYTIGNDTEAVTVQASGDGYTLTVPTGAKDLKFTVNPASGVTYTYSASNVSVTTKVENTFIVANPVNNGTITLTTSGGANMNSKTYTITITVSGT